MFIHQFKAVIQFPMSERLHEPNDHVMWQLDTYNMPLKIQLVCLSGLKFMTAYLVLYVRSCYKYIYLTVLDILVLSETGWL